MSLNRNGAADDDRQARTAVQQFPPTPHAHSRAHEADAPTVTRKARRNQPHDTHVWMSTLQVPTNNSSRGLIGR